MLSCLPVTQQTPLYLPSPRHGASDNCPARMVLSLTARGLTTGEVRRTSPRSMARVVTVEMVSPERFEVARQGRRQGGQGVLIILAFTW